MEQKLAIAAAIFIGGSGALANLSSVGTYQARTNVRRDCHSDKTITSPPGFCVTIFADNVGHARHLVVAADGTVYVNTLKLGENATIPAGGFLVALRGTNGAGRANQIVRFGPGVEKQNAGGTGIALYKGAVRGVERQDRSLHPRARQASTGR